MDYLWQFLIGPIGDINNDQGFCQGGGPPGGFPLSAPLVGKENENVFLILLSFQLK